MEQVKLVLQTREGSGTSSSNRLRDKGFIPGVVYGGTDKPVAVQLSRIEYDKIMRKHPGESLLFAVELNDNGKKVKDFIALLKDVQLNPVSDVTEHLDFLRVSMDKEIVVRVSVILKGEAIGLKKPGATIEHSLRELEVICLPKDIPHHIEVEVTNLDTHNAIHISDLKLPAGVRTKVDPAIVVVSVVFSTREEVAAPADGAAPAPELEVIKEKPKDEKAAEGAAAGAKPAAGAKAEAAPKK